MASWSQILRSEKPVNMKGRYELEILGCLCLYLRRGSAKFALDAQENCKGEARRLYGHQESEASAT